MADAAPVRTYNPYFTLQGGFMPRCILECPSITDAAKVCYIALASFAGRDKDTCWPSQATLGTRYATKERSVRMHLAELRDNGFIRIHQNGMNQSNTYEFISLEDWRSSDFMDRQKNAGPDRQDSSLLTGQFLPDGPANNCLTDRQKIAGPLQLITSVIEPLSLEPHKNAEAAFSADDPSRDENQKQPPPDAEAAPEPEDLNPCSAGFAEQSSYFDISALQLDEDISTFTKNAYRQSRGAKLTNSDLRRYSLPLASLEHTHGPEELRAALLQYLGKADDDWLRTNKWPIAAFLKHACRYVTEAGANAPHNPAAHLQVVPGRNGATAPPATSPAENRLQRDFAQEWDILVPARPVEMITERTRAKVAVAALDPDFAGNFAAICRRCERLIAAGEPTTFQWLFSGRDEPNWAALLEGKFDFLMKRKKRRQGGGEPLEDILARIEESEGAE